MSHTDSILKTAGRILRAGLAAAALLAVSCDQSPIFDSISKETEPKDPKVQGSPGKIVEFGSNAYVANGSIFRYPIAGSGSWEKAGNPDSGVFVLDLASTGTEILYALTAEGTSSTTTKIWKSTDASAWTDITATLTAALAGYSNFDSIYVANEILFIGAHKSTTEYAILAYDGSTATVVLSGLAAGGHLVGAVRDGTDYYAATSTLGVFSGATTASFGATAIAGSTGYMLTGLIVVGSEVVAVGDEILLRGISGTVSAVDYSDEDYFFTGAAYVYDSGGTNEDILLLGLGKTSDSFGYLEAVLVTDALPASISLKSPGSGSPTSTVDGDQYESSLGLVPVTSFWRDGAGILFVSTSGEGLWSYRDEEWNAEE